MSYICEVCDEKPCNLTKHVQVLEDEVRRIKRGLVPGPGVPTEDGEAGGTA